METHRQFFKHIYTLKPINKYRTRSENALLKHMQEKLQLSYRGPDLWNEFIGPNNDLLELNILLQ